MEFRGNQAIRRDTPMSATAISVGTTVGIAIGGAVCFGLIILGGLVLIMRWRHNLIVQSAVQSQERNTRCEAQGSSQILTATTLKRISGLQTDWQQLGSKEEIAQSKGMDEMVLRSAFEDPEDTGAPKKNPWQPLRPFTREPKDKKAPSISPPLHLVSNAVFDNPTRLYGLSETAGVCQSVPSNAQLSSIDSPRVVMHLRDIRGSPSSTVTVLRAPSRISKEREVKVDVGSAAPQNNATPTRCIGESVAPNSRRSGDEDTGHRRAVATRSSVCSPQVPLPALPQSYQSAGSIHSIAQSDAQLRHVSHESTFTIGSAGSSILQLSPSPPPSDIDKSSPKRAGSSLISHPTQAVAEGADISCSPHPDMTVPEDIPSTARLGNSLHLQAPESKDVFTDDDGDRMAVGRIQTAELLSVHRVSSLSELTTRQIDNSPGRCSQQSKVSTTGSPAERQRHTVLNPVSGNKPPLRVQTQSMSMTHEFPKLTGVLKASGAGEDKSHTISWPLCDAAPVAQMTVNHTLKTSVDNPNLRMKPSSSQNSLTPSSPTLSLSQYHPARRFKLQPGKPLPIYQQEFSMHLYEGDDAPLTIQKSRTQRGRPATIPDSPTDQKTTSSVQPLWLRDDGDPRSSVLIPGLNILANVAAAAEPNFQDPTQAGGKHLTTGLRDVEEVDIAEAMRECEKLLGDNHTATRNQDLHISQLVKSSPVVGLRHEIPRSGPATTTISTETSTCTTPVLTAPFPTLQHPSGPRAASTHNIKQSIEKLRRTNSEALASDTRGARRYLKLGRGASPCLPEYDEHAKENDPDKGQEMRRSRLQYSSVWDEGEKFWVAPSPATPPSALKQRKSVTWGTVEVRESVGAETPMSRKSLYDSRGF